jgi:hypothetical protein
MEHQFRILRILGILLNNEILTNAEILKAFEDSNKIGYIYISHNLINSLISHLLMQKLIVSISKKDSGKKCVARQITKKGYYAYLDLFTSTQNLFNTFSKPTNLSKN